MYRRIPQLLMIVLAIMIIALSNVTAYAQHKNSKQSAERLQKLNRKIDSIAFVNDSLSRRLSDQIKQVGEQAKVQTTETKAINKKIVALEEGQDTNTLLDGIGLLIAFIAGIVITGLGLIIGNVNSFRNKLFKEFQVEIFHDRINTEGDKITLLEFYLEMNYKNADELAVSYAYLEMPKRFSINSRENATLGDRMFGEPGKFYFGFPAMTIKSNKRIQFTVTNPEFLKTVEYERRKKFIVAVHTSRYGIVRSNTLVFSQGRTAFHWVVWDSVVDWINRTADFIKRIFQGKGA